MFTITSILFTHSSIYYSIVYCKLKIHGEEIMSHIFPCSLQGGKLLQLNPTCCIGKTILGGMYVVMNTLVVSCDLPPIGCWAHFCWVFQVWMIERVRVAWKGSFVTSLCEWICRYDISSCLPTMWWHIEWWIQVWTFVLPFKLMSPLQCCWQH